MGLLVEMMQWRLIADCPCTAAQFVRVAHVGARAWGKLTETVTVLLRILRAAVAMARTAR